MGQGRKTLYLLDSGWRATLFQYFRLPETGEQGELLPAAEILRRIEQRSKIKSGIRNMALFGRLLLKNNVTKKHTKTGNYYHVIEIW